MYIEISKEDSKVIRGIAVILMFFHHFCGFPEWLTSEIVCMEILPISFGGLSVMRIIAIFGCICVGIFTMSAGYIWGVTKRKSLKDQIRKVILVLIDYWFIGGLFIIVGLIFAEPFPNLKTFLLNMFGVGIKMTKEYISVSFGWYIGFYIIVILFLLSIHKLCDKLRCDWLIIIVFAILHLVDKCIGSEIVNLIFKDLLYWGPLFSIAYLIAKYNVINRVGNLMLPRCRCIVSFVILLGIFGIKCILGADIGGFNMYLLYTPPFWLALIYIINYLKDMNCRLIKVLLQILMVLGKYSMNLWLLHGIFFTPHRSLQSLVYLPRYGVLVTIWAFIILLPVAVLLDKLQRLAKGKIYRME